MDRPVEAAMNDLRIRALIKVPNVSAQNLAKLTAFLNGPQNRLPKDVAGPEGCAELLDAERESSNCYRVSVLVTIAYPYAGGQNSLKKSPGSIIEALFQCLGIFPPKSSLDEKPYYDRA